MEKLELSEEAIEALRLQKQAFLRTEIVEVGYDPFIFQNYLDSIKKGGGQDVDQWDMDELIDVVKKFKANVWIGNEVKIQEGSQDMDDENETKRASDPAIERGDSFSEAPQIIPSKEIPKQLPPLPLTKSNKKHDAYSDEKRKRFLETFLNDLIKNEEIRNTRLVVDFLNVVDANTYKIKKKEAEKLTRSNKLELNETLNGRIKLLIDNDSINTLNRLPSFLTEIELAYRKIKKVGKQLINDFTQVSNTLSILGDSFAKLFEITSKLNSSIADKKYNSMEEIYVTLNNLFISWGENINEQIPALEQNICEFFKYQRKEFTSFREIIKQRQSAYQEYHNFQLKLRNKKEKTFSTTTDTTKWEMDYSKIPINVEKAEFITNLRKNKEEAFKYMFFKETMIETELRDQFAYINSQTMEEVSRCLNEKFYKYCHNFVNLTSLQSESISEMHLIWADVNSLLSSGLKKGSEAVMKSQAKLQQKHSAQTNKSAALS